MDYKKIIKNQNLRFKILKFLSFIPDKTMLKLQYKIKTGRKLNLKNPKRYTEKIQWYKINYRNPIMNRCVDKFAVRQYVKEKGLEDILNKLYAVYDNIEDFDIESLPQKFVVKTTNSSGTNIFCKDKNSIKKEDIVNKINTFLSFKNIKAGREWAYYGIKPKIIVEKFLEDDTDRGIADYKFLCFNGNPEFIVYDIDRFIEHKRNFYDINWNYLEVSSDCPNFGDVVKKPEKLEEMIKIAKILSEDFPAVRVDLYCVKNKIYFGELTFYPWSGYVDFSPDDFDFTLGEKFNIQ